MNMHMFKLCKISTWCYLQQITVKPFFVKIATFIVRILSFTVRILCTQLSFSTKSKTSQLTNSEQKKVKKQPDRKIKVVQICHPKASHSFCTVNLAPLKPEQTFRILIYILTRGRGDKLSKEGLKNNLFILRSLRTCEITRRTWSFNSKRNDKTLKKKHLLKVSCKIR